MDNQQEQKPEKPSKVEDRPQQGIDFTTPFFSLKGWLPTVLALILRFFIAWLFSPWLLSPSGFQSWLRRSLMQC